MNNQHTQRWGVGLLFGVIVLALLLHSFLLWTFLVTGAVVTGTILEKQTLRFRPMTEAENDNPYNEQTQWLRNKDDATDGRFI